MYSFISNCLIAFMGMTALDYYSTDLHSIVGGLLAVVIIRGLDKIGEANGED